jgi:hypothetical protein
MADPNRTDEFVATAETERLLGWHVGEVIPMGFYTTAQSNEAAFGTPKGRYAARTPTALPLRAE